MRKPSLLVIFLTVFIDLIGFGIVLPVLPQYGMEFGAAGWQVGLIVASYSFMQFLFAPAWGRLSDRIGRRPVLLISTFGASVSYVLFALAAVEMNLWLLVASRVFAGICGANLSVASAYIADVSPPEERSKRMGLIGMAFGLGFILGPVLGALSADWWGAAGPGWTAAAICAANLVLAFFILGESRRSDSDPSPRVPRREQWGRVLKRPQLGLLVGIFFMATFCFTSFESAFVVMFVGTAKEDGKARIEGMFKYTEKVTLSENGAVEWKVASGTEVKEGDVLGAVGDQQITAPRSGRLERDDVSGRINYTKTIAYYLFAYCGLIGAIVQGGLIGRLVKMFGEKKMIFGGLVLVGVSLAVLPYCDDTRGLAWLMGGLALFAISSGVYRAPTFGLISLNASEDEQGEVMGVTQSVGSLARIIGPIFALSLFDVQPALPYLICAVLAVLAGLIAWVKLAQPAAADETGQ
ncbi:MAG: MFS transporter [Verrucomicrobiota bacterium]|nr:MFS transporter [Verrucomicrobiota bacterium]